jgi:hypothetical protein
MTPEALLAWAGGRGAPVVAAALARHLTDRTRPDQPEVAAGQAAAWIRNVQAATLADPSCASLVVSFWFDPQSYAAPEAGTTEAQGIAVFSAAATEPAVAFALCAAGGETCRVPRLEDLDGDGRNEMLVERAALGPAGAPTQVLYDFAEDSDPLPVWVSDDDAVRRALFGEEGEVDAGNQMAAGDVRFYVEDDAPRIRVDYRLSFCSAEGACEPTGAQTLVFTRLGDVYLLPGEPEPGAPWGRPEGEEGAAVP